MKTDDNRVFVPVASAKKIAAIEPTARRLGWPVARLFDPNLDDHRRPCGLASVLELDDDTIEAVRRDVIVIRKNAYHTLKFPRS
jgi:hypothetical protein